jgi:ribosomal protein S18 acetylase RimI-like enzyme
VTASPPAGFRSGRQSRAGRQSRTGRQNRAGLIEWGRERARTAPWRSDDNTALIAPWPDAPAPSTSFIRHCLDLLAGQGFTTVITSALAPHEQRPFLAAGFDEHERLHLLGHDLAGLPSRPQRPALRRGKRADRDRALLVDRAAFDSFWRLDGRGLQDALDATPSTRFRVVAIEGDTSLGAYAISGRSGRHGYLQRLAVDPSHQRQGYGRALVLDGLHWMRRHGVKRAVVNTQLDNLGALELYRGIGFRAEPDGLAVLRRELSRRG